MGLADRDDTRERGRTQADPERPFTPPPSSGLSVTWMVLLWVATVAVLFQLYSNYERPKPQSRPQAAAALKQSECKALDARITQLDAMARQPQSGQMQDWIAGQRRDARDRQFRIRC